MADATSPSEVTAPRVIGTIVAAAVTLQSLSALRDPAPDAPNMLWNLAPAVLAIAALALFWWRPPARLPAAVLMFAAVVTQIYAMFGDSTFARVAFGAIVAVWTALFAWIYLVLPLLAWRRGRWPVDPIPYVPFADDTRLPEPAQGRVRALMALGFVPGVMHVRSEGSVAVTIAVLAHPHRGALAKITHARIDRHALTATRLTARSIDASPRFSIIDTHMPAPFPAPPTHRVLLFPDADMRTLLAHFTRLHPHQGAVQPASSADLAATMEQSLAEYERWLVDAGYVARARHGDERRYTLKGAFSAVLRPLFPWKAIERARFVREGRNALLDASRAGP